MYIGNGKFAVSQYLQFSSLLGPFMRFLPHSFEDLGLRYDTMICTLAFYLYQSMSSIHLKANRAVSGVLLELFVTVAGELCHSNYSIEKCTAFEGLLLSAY